MSRLRFDPSAMERYTLGPLGLTMAIITWPSIVAKVLVTRTSEYVTKKAYKPVMRTSTYCDRSVDHMDTNNLASGFVNVLRTKGKVFINKISRENSMNVLELTRVLDSVVNY